VAKAEKTFEYASAAQMVLDSFSEFEPKVASWRVVFLMKII